MLQLQRLTARAQKGFSQAGTVERLKYVEISQGNFCRSSNTFSSQPCRSCVFCSEKWIKLFQTLVSTPFSPVLRLHTVQPPPRMMNQLSTVMLARCLNHHHTQPPAVPWCVPMSCAMCGRCSRFWRCSREEVPATSHRTRPRRPAHSECGRGRAERGPWWTLVALLKVRFAGFLSHGGTPKSSPYMTGYIQENLHPLHRKT